MKIDPTSPNIFLPLLTAIFLLLYLVTLEPTLAVLCLASFLAYVALDLLRGTEKKGKSSFLEIIYAIVGAAAVWLILSTILQTPSPLDVVTSCSMKPVLDRGDLVIVQGKQFYEAPLYQYADFPTVTTNRTNCTISKRGSEDTLSQCTNQLVLANASATSRVPVSREDVVNNDIIVFESSSAGLVIHRVVLALESKSSSAYVYLTKGDNNQVVDQEAGLLVVEQSKIHGKMLARIPLVGYLRLFLAGQFTEPRGCDTLVDLTSNA